MVHANKLNRLLRMNKRADAQSYFRDNMLFFLAEFAFFVLMLVWILGFQDNLFLWEDFYAKEIVRVINMALPEQDVYLDITDAVSIALNKGVARSDIVQFNNVANTVTVKLSNSGGTSFSYFNDVDIVDWELEIPSPGAGPEVSRIYFRIVEAQDDE